MRFRHACRRPTDRRLPTEFAESTTAMRIRSANAGMSRIRAALTSGPINDAARFGVAWRSAGNSHEVGGRPRKQAPQRLRDAASADDRRALARGHLIAANVRVSQPDERRRHVLR